MQGNRHKMRPRNVWQVKYLEWIFMSCGSLCWGNYKMFTGCGDIAPKSRKACDIGQGFYMGDLPDQPKGLIAMYCGRCIRGTVKVS